MAGKLYNAAGTEVEQTDFLGAGTTEVTMPSTYTVEADVFEDHPIPGSTRKFRTLKFYEGQTITQADVDAAYAEATVTAISPDHGAAGGGTVVTMTGTNLSNARGATFGGSAATAFSVLSDTQVRCTTPAHAAGAVTVVVDIAAGDVTKTTFYTYDS